jgi:hypothetical protein
MGGFPGFDRLFALHDPLASRPFRGRFEHHNTGFELSRGEEDVRRPILVRWDMGGAVPMDVVWTTSVHPLIVSSRLVDLLEENRITGWSRYPVTVLDREGDEADTYYGLVVTGRCGVIDLTRSEIELRQMPGGFFPEFRGHYFDPESWDGSDFCVPFHDRKDSASTQRIVTERVIQLLKRHRVRNIRAVRLTEATFPTSIYEIGLRHLLPRDFRARVAEAYEREGVERP